MAAVRLVIQENFLHLRENNPGLIIVTVDLHVNPLNLDQVVVNVLGPGQQQYQVAQQATRLSRIFTFQPREPGLYHVTGKRRGEEHINGSPGIINVTRDYGRIGNCIASYDILTDQERSRITRQPIGMCWNPVLNAVLIPCRDLNIIFVVNANGNVMQRFGGLGTANGLFRCPAIAAYDSVGRRVLVSDTNNNRVQIFSANLDFQSAFGQRGTMPGEFRGPVGITVSSDGQVIAVADTNNNRIQLFDRTGRYLREFSGLEFQSPFIITFNISGKYIYFGDYSQYVSRLDVSSSDKDRIETNPELQRPAGISVDPAGNLVIADTNIPWLYIRNILGQSNRIRLVNLIPGQTDNGTPRHVITVRHGYIAVITSTWRLQFF